MNVLSFGQPFFRNCRVLDLYRGPHDIRSIGVTDGPRYRFDPLKENLADVLERLAPEFKPDLILCWFPENDPPPLGIEDAPCTTVALAGDWNMFSVVMRHSLARYDAVLCDKPGAEILRNEYVEPVHLFPLYAQDSRYHRPRGVERDIDIFFAGSLNMAQYRDRSRYLDRVARLSDRYKVVIVDGAFDDDYGKLLARSKIAFNRSVRGELNLRTFETMAAGALAFLERENLEVRDWFEDGRELVLYGDDDLEERLVHYLENPSEAQAIAARGLERAPAFAPENRLDAVIEWAANAPSSGRRFRELPPFEQALDNLMMYSVTLRGEYYPLRERLVGEQARLKPDDARAWGAAGRAMIYPKRAAHDRNRTELALKLYDKALRLAPGSAPYAFGAATACQWSGLEAEARPYLEAVVEATGLDGAEFVPGWFDEEVWLRWMRAVAEGRASVNMLKAEACFKLACHAANAGHLDSAVAWAGRARVFDSAHTGAVLVLGELLWSAGRGEEAAELLLGHIYDFPLEAAVRDRVADMLAVMGRTAEAEALRDEARRVRAALCLPADEG